MMKAFKKSVLKNKDSDETPCIPLKLLVLNLLPQYQVILTHMSGDPERPALD